MPAQNTATQLLRMLYDSPNGRTEEEILSGIEVSAGDYLNTIMPLLESGIIIPRDMERQRVYRLDRKTRRTMFCKETGLNLSQTAEPKTAGITIYSIKTMNYTRKIKQMLRKGRVLTDRQIAERFNEEQSVVTSYLQRLVKRKVLENNYGNYYSLKQKEEPQIRRTFGASVEWAIERDSRL